MIITGKGEKDKEKTISRTKFNKEEDLKMICGSFVFGEGKRANQAVKQIWEGKWERDGKEIGREMGGR